MRGMGLVVGRVQPVQGLGPVLSFDVKRVRELYRQFEDACPSPTLWERAFYELLGCFDTPEACARAFAVLDSDNDGLVDARETFGALAILCKGHLRERLALLFDLFDLNKENDMGYDEAFLMLRRTTGGLRKMTGLLAPPEQVIHLMVRQIWRSARKHRDVRITSVDWQAWWERDATCRHALQAFVMRPEDQRGLPTPDKWKNVDYAKDANEQQDEEPRTSVSVERSSPDFEDCPATRPNDDQALPAHADAQGVAAASPVDRARRSPSVPSPPLVDYEGLVRDGHTESPFLDAQGVAGP